MVMHSTKYIYLTIVLAIFSCETPPADPPNQEQKQVKKKVRLDKKHSYHGNNIEVTKKEEKTRIVTVFELEEWENDFYHQKRVNCFNEDSITHFEDSIISKGSDSCAVIGKLAHQIYNKTELYPWEESALEYTDYLYSIQTRKEHIGIVVFGMNEGWVYQLKYYSYDHLGRKVDEVPLAEWGGDGGYFRKSNGCFINDSTYHYEFVDTEHNFEKDTMNVIDSGQVEYVIHEDGEIEKLER